MPSASSKSSQQILQVSTNDLLQEPIKNVLQVFEKKQRNLEKRKLKLAETKKKADTGAALNEDQKLALKNWHVVENSLDTVKDLHKLVQSLEQEYNKLVKKEQKRIKQESRDQTDSKNRTLGLKIVEIQAILSDLSEDVRPDFLAGTNGACVLTDDELSYLDEIYELINPAQSEEEGERKKLSERVTSAGEHILNLVEGKDKEVVGVTYKQVLDIVNKIQACGYFDKDSEQAGADEEEAVAEPSEEVEESKEQAEPEEEYQAVSNPVSPDDAPSPTIEEIATTPINGVDLPPEVNEQIPDDEKIDFLGESEINVQGVAEQPPLNPVSPEFVPKHSSQTAGDDNSGWDEPSSQQGEFQQQTSNQHGSGFRGRGRGGGGGNRGRGGRGFNRGGGGFRGGRQDGGNYRGDGGNYRADGGNYRGDGGNYRGGNRGGRGGNRGDGYRGGNRGGRGGPRGGGNRGAPREGGFGRPSNQ